VLALGGLLIAIALTGVVGIVINRNIHDTVERAIAFDVELEDRGDDLRVAILDVRHYHRDLLLNNPSVPRIVAWQERYAIMLVEIEALDELLVRSPADADLPEVGDLRALAEDYYARFAAVVDAESDAEFVAVAEDLLPGIDAMQEIAERVDAEGERRAAAALSAIDDASGTGTVVLVAVMIGLGAVGALLAFAVLRLVQDQRRLVAAEQAVVGQMAEAARAQTNFIADASHELRTPLTVLRGNAEIGLALQDECTHAEILEEIVDESSRMSRLVDDLLFLARSDASSAPLELRDVETEDLMRGLVDRAEVLARERGAALAATVRSDGRILADRERVEQAVLILVDNAAKYGPADGTVELDARTADGRLIVEVRDRGPGIPAEHLSRVFERFYRANGAGRGRPAGGAGLGLAIAAVIVEGHGGRIDATTPPDGGTLMTISLPLVAAGLPQPGAHR
jgi:signal transduction histidine kinase